MITKDGTRSTIIYPGTQVVSVSRYYKTKNSIDHLNLVQLNHDRYKNIMSFEFAMIANWRWNKIYILKWFILEPKLLLVSRYYRSNIEHLNLA